MSRFKEFLLQGSISNNLTAEVKLDRFPYPFLLRSITEKEHKVIREASQKRSRDAKGQLSTEMDYSGYMARLLAACCVDPDLKDAELQAHYGVVGEEALLEIMLLAGEYSELVSAAAALNKGITDINEAIDEAKN